MKFNDIEEGKEYMFDVFNEKVTVLSKNPNDTTIEIMCGNSPLHTFPHNLSPIKKLTPKVPYTFDVDGDHM